MIGLNAQSYYNRIVSPAVNEHQLTSLVFYLIAEMAGALQAVELCFVTNNNGRGRARVVGNVGSDYWILYMRAQPLSRHNIKRAAVCN